MKSTSKVKIENIFKDKRGAIFNILHKNFGSCLLINSKKNSIRANHFHKKDWHYCYILKGKIEYYSRKVGSKRKPKKEIFTKEDLFFTPSLVEHAMYYPENTQFLVLARLSRKEANYEKDTVRVKLI